MPAAAPAVAVALQNLVGAHLTAIEHYVSLEQHFRRWGYSKLAAAAGADVAEERGHLDRLLGRCEYFDLPTDMDHPCPVWPRHDLPGILNASLDLETATATAERQAVLTCRGVGDELSALVFAANLEGSEDSIEKIEAARLQISQMGLDNYLSAMV
jgi:bacterioferritin (cytochrome b1)